MIRSILDNDLYKFTMQQAVHMLYPHARVKYRFIDRGGAAYPEGFSERLTQEIANLASLSLKEEELAYLQKSCYFLTPVYLDFLQHYRFDPDEVTVTMNHGNLGIEIEGAWYRTILWEVPLMALVSELYFRMTSPAVMNTTERLERVTMKGARLRDGGVRFADFGTRRRYSAANHEEVLLALKAVPGSTLIGTSNLHFARELGIRPMGTHAHEWFMFHATRHGYRHANKAAIEAWTEVFQGYLGIALTDTYTTAAFLESFDAVKARLFDGVRHDSGDPFHFADTMIGHYERLHINPASKTIVFSDGLDTDTAVAIVEHCAGRINASFGIGTHLTNDVGRGALNMVIKLSECQSRSGHPWVPAVKLSDVPGKHTGDPEEIGLCLRTITGSES